MQVYLVRSFWGAYSDAGERIEGVFATRQLAIDWIKKQECRVYQDHDDVYADYEPYVEKDTYVIHPTRHREWWQFDCIANLDTPAFEILTFEVVE